MKLSIFMKEYHSTKILIFFLLFYKVKENKQWCGWCSFVIFSFFLFFSELLYSRYSIISCTWLYLQYITNHNRKSTCKRFNITIYNDTFKRIQFSLQLSSCIVTGRISLKNFLVTDTLQVLPLCNLIRNSLAHSRNHF